jgi:hypothetical protein
MAWFLKRNFRVGMNEVHIARLHGETKDKALMLLETFGRLALSPVYAVALLSRKRRFSVLRKLARAAGRIGAVAGVEHREYATRHVAR